MKVRKLLIIITALTIPFASQVLADEKAPTVDKQITGLQNMCSTSAEYEVSPLYQSNAMYMFSLYAQSITI